MPYKKYQQNINKHQKNKKGNRERKNVGSCYTNHNSTIFKNLKTHHSEQIESEPINLWPSFHK